MWDKIINSIGGSILGGADKLTQTIFGSATGREEASHREQMTVMQQFMAEFGPRENRTKWDSLVDGLNRLPRPVITFGVVGLFAYCMVDPEGFAAAMVALALMPEYGWAMMATVIVFWFGGKFLEGRAKAMTVTPPDPETVDKVLSFYERRAVLRDTAPGDDLTADPEDVRG
jgi:hypothetical protein